MKSRTSDAEPNAMGQEVQVVAKSSAGTARWTLHLRSDV